MCVLRVCVCMCVCKHACMCVPTPNKYTSSCSASLLVLRWPASYPLVSFSQFSALYSLFVDLKVRNTHHITGRLKSFAYEYIRTLWIFTKALKTLCSAFRETWPLIRFLSDYIYLHFVSLYRSNTLLNHINFLDSFVLLLVCINQLLRQKWEHNWFMWHII